MSLKNYITSELKANGADFVHFVDISHLQQEQNRGLPNAILFGICLSPNYIQEVMDTPDYVQARIETNFGFDDDELYLKELKADELSDILADSLIKQGYKAYSQSDANQIATNSFDGVYEKTLLPHKTIALLTGIGWIGKHNLLVTSQYGSAICLGTVLTDAPLATVSHPPTLPRCGACNICQEVCDPKVLKGCIWNTSIQREDIIDVYRCTTCMKCLVSCPWTQAYVKRANK